MRFFFCLSLKRDDDQIFSKKGEHDSGSDKRTQGSFFVNSNLALLKMTVSYKKVSFWFCLIK